MKRENTTFVFQIIYKMPENKPFTLEQDKIILYLYDELKIKQWSMVAKKMTEDYKMERNAKQCRDRYRQVLDPFASPDWTQQEEKYLYQLHSSIGNKWALIASYFPGKTDNYVKNYFYSKIRKALRHLNRVIKTYFKKEFKQIKIAAIYKIIEGFEEQFKQKPIISQEVSNECCILKDALLTIADEVEQLDTLEEEHIWKERLLIEKIVDFNKNYKKKSKKEKRQSLQIEELFKPARKIDLILPVQNQQGEDSQFEGVNSVASSDSQQNDCLHKEGKFSRDDSMKQERDQLRRSPVYVIVKDDELRDSPNSIKSGIEIRISDVISSSKIQQEDNEKRSFGLESSGKMDICNLGFIRSSFTSYRSRSQREKSQADMMCNLQQEMPIPQNFKDNCTEMDIEKDESLFRSHK